MKRSRRWIRVAGWLLVCALGAPSVARAQPAPEPSAVPSAVPSPSPSPQEAPSPSASLTPSASPTPAPSEQPGAVGAAQPVGQRPPPWPYPYPPPYAFYPPPKEGEGGDAPKRPEPRGEWYGWQTILIHGISASLLPTIGAGDGAGAPFTIPVAMSGMILGGPIVHWSHGRVARGFAVLGMHFGSAFVVGLTGGAIACTFGACGGSYGSVGFLAGNVIGWGVGSLTAFAIDVSLLSFEEVPKPKEHPEAKNGWPAIALLPSVDIGPGRGVVGLGGSF